jgi:predicted dehydrogenase
MREMNGERELRAAVVGLGYWGPNLLRNFTGSQHWNVAWIVDLNKDRLARMQRLYPNARASTELDAALDDPNVDLIAVATPPSSHYAIVERVIAAGKHVLVEKPLAERASDARLLLEKGNAAGVRLFTDHTFLYTGAVEAMHRLHETGELGEVYYAESQRVNLGLFQQSNVIWDLAPHDISILNHVFGRMPNAISCHARACINPSVWDVAFLCLRYSEDCIAQIHLSWLSPVKVRRLMVSASNRMLIWDDVDPSEKLRIYDKGVVLNPTQETLAAQMVSYRTGEVRIPIVDTREALSKLIDDLSTTLRIQSDSRIEGNVGYEVVRCIEAACESARLGGRWVRLDVPATSRRGTVEMPATAAYAVSS